jgi:hypothetical protein
MSTPKDNELDVKSELHPRLSSPVLLQLNEVKAEFEAKLELESSVNQLESKLSLKSVSDADTLSTCDSDDSYVVSPSGRCRRLDRYAKETADQEKTTVMMRNIPPGLSQKKVFDEIELVCPGVNFLYLPQSRSRDGNVGYCFINFADAKTAVQCMREFQGTKLINHGDHSKTIDVGYATLQGFKQNVRFYRRSKIIKSKNRPIIKHDG